MRRGHFISRKENAESWMKSRSTGLQHESCEMIVHSIGKKRGKRSHWKLKEEEKSYLKELASTMEISFFVGDSPLTFVLMAAIDEAIEENEILILQFLTLSEQFKVSQFCHCIERKVGCEVIEWQNRRIILFRRNETLNKRRIKFP